MEYTEKEVENYLLGNPQVLKLRLSTDRRNWDIYSQLDLENFGILDLVIFEWDKKKITVIEVKRDEAKPDSFGQCLRYMGGIRDSAYGYKVKGIVASNGLAKDSAWLFSNIKNVSHWNFKVDVGTGITGEYSSNTGWTCGEGKIGTDFYDIMEGGTDV